MDATPPSKSVSVKRDYSMIRGRSILSITEDDINTMLMQSMLERLRHESTDNGTNENQEPIGPSNEATSSQAKSPSSNTNSILFQQNVNDLLTTGTNSHSRSIIERRRPPRKQHISKRRNRAGTTKVIFKRKICKEPSPALAELRKVLVMEALESDTDTASENEENADPQDRTMYDPAFLDFINNSENKENIDLDDFQHKLKL